MTQPTFTITRLHEGYTINDDTNEKEYGCTSFSDLLDVLEDIVPASSKDGRRGDSVGTVLAKAEQESDEFYLGETVHTLKHGTGVVGVVTQPNNEGCVMEVTFPDYDDFTGGMTTTFFADGRFTSGTKPDSIYHLRHGAMPEGQKRIDSE